MGSKLNLHKLMGTDAGYLRALAVDDDDRRHLSAAREEIRDTLRSAFRDWETHVSRQELFDADVAASAQPARVPVPKFRIQGSFAYWTVNDCQNPPLHQIDQDDGVFLPLSFVTAGGRTRPIIAAHAYFLLVERALAKVCALRGWRLNPGKAKNSCVRVEISSRLHIDLPLYAIRDSAFEQLVEFAAADSRIVKSAALNDVLELDDQIYRSLLSAEIILADRKNGWIESDPRKLEIWFENAVKAYGPIVRDLCRSFKAMRDAKFDDGLSSICIMACVVNALNALGRVDEKRLDLALASVADKISEQLRYPVFNPAFPQDPQKCLCGKWDADYRAEVQQLFRSAAGLMAEATDGGFIKSLAISRARAAFGDRVPQNEELITLMTPAAVVRATPAEPQPRPMAPRTKSG